MAWFQGIFGTKQRRTPSPAAAEECLTHAGWRPGRDCDISASEQALQHFGFQLHDKGRTFLREYQGLQIDVPISGVSDIKGFVHFAPERAIQFLTPKDTPRLRALMPESACPIGTTSGHTMHVFMDEDGRSYLLDMEWRLFANLAFSPAETIQVLCDGRNGRVDSHILGEDGRPTHEIIHEGDERRHWEMEKFPALAPFLPPVSLSPARRPPTWCAMVRAAEDMLAPRGSPRQLVVSCGGMLAKSGSVFFVAHCENCLYVRARAGLQVSPLPPGVQTSLRTGEIVALNNPI